MLDWLKGIVVSCGTVALMAIYNVIIESGTISIADWKQYAKIGIMAIIAYLGKNFLTNSEGKLASEPKAEIK